MERISDFFDKMSMLKNRQEGILNLHGLWSTAALLFLFLLHKQIFAIIGYKLTSPLMNVYMLGVAVGSLLNIRILRRYAENFISIGWSKSFNLSYHQILRIMLVLLAIVFAMKDHSISRVFLSSYLVVAFLALFAINKILPKYLCRLSFKTQVIPTIIVGTTESLRGLGHWIKNKADYGIDIVGYVSEFECPPLSEQPIPCMGAIGTLDKTIEKEGIAQVIVEQSSLSKEAAKNAMAISQRLGCRVRIYNNWQKEYNHRVIVEHEGDYTFFTYEDEPLENPINRMLKRGFDIALSLPIVAFVLPPLTLLIWAIQRKQSPGPIFYAQPRTGMTKRTFHIIKYRTMHVSDENRKDIAKQATKNDNRVYPLARLLRKTSIDELPQFINVLLGEMSVAGPRPHLIDHDNQFSEKLRAYKTRHFVKPGITGLAQSLGFRGEISEFDLLQKRIAYDIAYINTWSFLLDIKIILMTAKMVLFPPKSAY